MTPEPSPVRRALIAAVLAVALFAAVIVQLTVVNRLPLPGAAAPDLVLLLVTAIAVGTSPATAAVTGFAGGLALDVAPPAAHYVGEYALVYCLVAYAAARVMKAIWDTTGERDPIATFTVMACATVAGEAGKAVLGMLTSDPDVTRPAVTQVLPGAVLYDLVLSPLVFWLVARVALRWGTAGERAPGPEFGRAAQLASVFRQASAGAAPNLRLAGTGEHYNSPQPARRVPKLRLSDARAASSRRTGAAGPAGAPVSLAGGRTPKLNFAGSAPARGAARPVVRTPGKNWLRSAPSRVTPAAKRAPHAPSRGWLGPAGAGGRAGGHPRRPRGVSRGAGSPLAARQARSADDALAARSAPSGLSALSGAGTPLARQRTPQAGWLRPSRASAPFRQRRSPRGGWLGRARRPRTVIGSGVSGHGGTFRRRRGAGGNWYAATPSGAWLRRGRHPWRKRSQRLLRLVGVGR